jgi:hypothetical protein
MMTHHSKWVRPISKFLNGILPLDDIHQWDSLNLPYSSAELAIAGRYDVTSISGDTLDEAVICVCAFVGAWEAFETWISGHSTKNQKR